MLTQLIERLPLLKGLLDFAFPPLCSGCGAYFDEPAGICPECLEAIDWYDDPFCLTCGDFVPRGDSCSRCGEDSFLLFPGGNYTDPLKRAIVNYKFHGAMSLAGVLSERVIGCFESRILGLQPTLLVPIPLHPGREHQRGYNQAAVFAQALSRLLDLPVEEEILHRIKKKKPQARLRKSARAANVRGVFSTDPEAAAHLAEARLLLVDDVVTSGETVIEARRTLASSGLRVVGAISMAHGL
ncbi:MAG: ComF family protein [bacterium]|nr:ComF family protein [bacterium]